MQYFKTSGNGQFFAVEGDRMVSVSTYDFNPCMEVSGPNDKRLKVLKARPCFAQEFHQAQAEASAILKGQTNETTQDEYYRSMGGGQLLKVAGDRTVVVSIYDFNPSIEAFRSDPALITGLGCQRITGKEFRHYYRQVSDHVAAQGVETVEMQAAA